MVRDNLLPYPDFNEESKIHTDARNFQLGAVITQNVKTIDLYSRKLIYPPKNTVTEK